MSKKELNNKDLDGVAGGDSVLDEYLRKIGKYDKNKTLVDYDDKSHLELKHEVEIEDDGNVYVVKRERSSSEIDPDL